MQEVYTQSPYIRQRLGKLTVRDRLQLLTFYPHLSEYPRRQQAACHRTSVVFPTHQMCRQRLRRTGPTFRSGRADSFIRVTNANGNSIYCLEEQHASWYVLRVSPRDQLGSPTRNLRVRRPRGSKTIQLPFAGGFSRRF